MLEQNLNIYIGYVYRLCICSLYVYIGYIIYEGLNERDDCTVEGKKQCSISVLLQIKEENYCSSTVGIKVQPN